MFLACGDTPQFIEAAAKHPPTALPSMMRSVTCLYIGQHFRQDENDQRFFRTFLPDDAGTGVSPRIA